MSGLLLGSDISDAIRSAKEARDACELAKWEKARDVCNDAHERLSKVENHPLLLNAEREKVEGHGIQLPDLSAQLTEHARKRSDKPAPVRFLIELNAVIAHLSKVEGRMRNVISEFDHET